MKNQTPKQQHKDFLKWRRQNKFLESLKSREYLCQFESASDFLGQVFKDAENEGWEGLEKGDLGEALFWAKSVVVDRLPVVHHHTNIPQELKDRRKFSTDGKENGIDFVVVDQSNEECAVQVKLYKKETLTKEDIDSFFSEASNFDRRVVSTTTAKITNKIDESKYTAFKKHDWFLLSNENWQKIVSFFNGDADSIKFKEWEYRDDQDDRFVPDCVSGLKNRGRSVAVGPTGFGKTISALKVWKELNTKVNVVATPRISISNQWISQIVQWVPDALICAVYTCENKTIDTSGDGQITIKAMEDSLEINEWHEKNKSHKGPIFYVLVYDSLPKFQQANISVDYAIIDEAHFTVGPREKIAAKIWFDNYIKIAYRLATTASPSNNLPDPNVSLYNEDVCGKLDFYMTLREATEKGYVNSSKNYLHVITDSDINRNSGFTFIDGTPVANYRAALIVAIKNILEDRPNAKILVKHGGIPATESFSGSGANGLKRHVSENVWIGHVTSKSRKSELEKAKAEFRDWDGPAVLSHCDILNEGYDEPCIDVIVWATPTKSEVKAIQFPGRGLRTYPGKPETQIHVVLLFNEESGETISEALDDTNFDTVCEVLHDNMCPDGVWKPMRGIEVAPQDRPRVEGYTNRLIEDFWDIRGNILNHEAWFEAMETRLLSEFISSWSDDYEKLVNYVAALPDGKINPLRHDVDFPKGHEMTNFVRRQRSYFKKGYSANKKELMEKIPGWVWDLEAVKMNSKIDEICEYLKNDVPTHYAIHKLYGDNKQRHQYPAVNGERKKMAKLMGDIRRGKIKLTKEQTKKLKRANFDFRQLWEYRRDESIRFFNDLYENTKSFTPPCAARQFDHIYRELCDKLEENEWKLMDEETGDKDANFYREILLGLEAGVDKFIELAYSHKNGIDMNGKLANAIKKAKESFELHGHLLHLDKDTKAFLDRQIQSARDVQEEHFARARYEKYQEYIEVEHGQINNARLQIADRHDLHDKAFPIWQFDLKSMMFEDNPWWYMQERVALDFLQQIQIALDKRRDEQGQAQPHILDVVTRDASFDDLVLEFNLQDPKYIKDNFSFSGQIIKYFKMAWPIKHKGEFPQTWLYDMLKNLRRNSIEYVTGRKQTNQIPLAKRWQKFKDNAFCSNRVQGFSGKFWGCSRDELYIVGWTLRTEVPWLKICLEDWDSYNPVDSKNKQVDGDLEKAIENNETHYLPPLPKAWCAMYSKILNTIEKNILDNKEFPYEFSAGSREASWLTKQRDLNKDGKLSEQRLKLLNKGHMAKAFDTNNRVRGHMQIKVEKPEGSWQDLDTGEWCMKCSECDSIRKVKHMKSLYAANICKKCADAKRSLTK